MARFRLQTSTVFKNLSNSTLVTPLSLAKNNGRYGSFQLSGSIKLNNKFEKSYFTKIQTKSTKSSDLNNNDSPNSKASSIVQSILHGSPLLKEEERQTHSKLIARGKYVHELQSI
jgi:hypothetical protein